MKKTMKSIFSACMFAALLFALSGCSNSSGGGSDTPATPPTPASNPEEAGETIVEFSGTDYTVLQAGTNGTAGTSATYVNFGDWPQSEKSSSVTVDEKTKSITGAYTYYKGSDNAWYAKFNSKYYKVEPIKWRLLTNNYNGKKLLLAENILIACQYYDYSGVNRTINSEVIYPHCYEHSKLRAFLNGLTYVTKASEDAEQTQNSTFNEKGFLQTAFTASEQERIVASTVSVTFDANTWNYDLYGTPYVNESSNNDKIFVLSKEEVTNTEYGFDNTSRIRTITSFAKESGVVGYKYISDGQYEITGNQGRWHLCAPSFRFTSAIDFVNSAGITKNTGVEDDIGVVPALCVN